MNHDKGLMPEFQLKCDLVDLEKELQVNKCGAIHTSFSLEDVHFPPVTTFFDS
jgi:hypothetical protein